MPNDPFRFYTLVYTIEELEHLIQTSLESLQKLQLKVAELREEARAVERSLKP